MRAPNIQPVFETFGTELSNLDGFFKKNSKAFETEEIVKKDAARDFTGVKCFECVLMKK